MRFEIEKEKTKRTIMHFIWKEREEEKKKSPAIIQPPYIVTHHTIRKSTWWRFQKTTEGYVWAPGGVTCAA
jgi:hypothetical protein